MRTAISRHKYRAVATAVALAALTAAAIGYAGRAREGVRHDMAPVQIAPAVASPSVGAAAPVPADALLARILERVKSDEIVSAKLVSTIEGASAREAETTGEIVPPAPGPFLEVTVRDDGTPAGAFRGIWFANLIGGALADDFAGHGLEPLRSVHILLQKPDGTIAEGGSGIGRVVPFQQFSGESPASLAGRVRAAAARKALEVKSLDVVPAVQNAPALVAQTSKDSAAFVHEVETTDLLGAIFGDTRNLEGFYLEVVGSDGEPLAKVAVANRSGVGQMWVNPRYGTAGHTALGGD
jgi:hypothetical protein